VRIALGNDHRGFKVKQSLIEFLNNLGYSCHDFGSNSAESVDYPDFARTVARAVSSGEYAFGILICSTGIGMCIAANKVKGIRAAVCRSVHDAVRSRQHNNANVLCLAGEGVDLKVNQEIVKVFLTTSFEGGRHVKRIEKISAMETEQLDNT
jgi:ribose 5-phosphate isomerase B